METTRTIEETMQAVTHHRFGDPGEVLAVRTIATPSPGAGEILIAVAAAGISIGDWLTVAGLPLIARPSYGITKPKQATAGQEMAGRVVAVGEGVTRFTTGDNVFGFASGAFAEYAVAREEDVASVPAHLPAIEAAAIPVSALAAYQALHGRGEVSPGDQVLIIGASGAVGTYAVQIARAVGAVVTAVNSSRNASLVRRLGADHVIDYTVDAIPERKYDVIIDLVGKTKLKQVRGWLTETGTLVLVGGSGGPVFMGFGRTLRAMLLSPLVKQRLRPLFSKPDRDDLESIARLVADGRVSPVLDRTHALENINAAMNHIGSRHTQGKTVVTI